MAEPIKRDPQSAAIGVVRSSGFSETGFGIGSVLPAALDIGTVLAQRYEIVALAGEGGMGHVYKAHDRELDRMVALKTIRPDLASNPSMLARFKQEVSLASSITHRNVIRLYDLGESDQFKFITMEFIEGEDLRSEILRRGKLPPEEAAEVMRQVCLALEAAHAVGVIHRDLKPQNIMREPSGRVVVMDFGLARTLTTSGMTQTGALVGTMEYMSPEQAMGGEIDSRSDLFAAGLILFEALTGRTPFQAESAIASLVMRSREQAVAATTIDRTVPPPLSNIISKALEREPAKRYSTAREMVDDLEAWQGPRSRLVGARPSRVPSINRNLIIGAALFLALAAGGLLWRASRHAPAQQASTAPVEPVLSVAILPFRNASGDSQIDWMGSSMAEMLGTDIGQSTKVRTVSTERIHQILQDLHIGPDSALDPNTLARIASFVNADVVVSGQYVKMGDQVRVDANFRDLKRDRAVSLKTESGEKDLLTAVDNLAKSVRDNLSVTPEVAKEMAATAFKPASKSLDALRAYNEGLELVRQGKSAEALKKFQAATNQDSGFALAYSRLAQTYAALGYDSEAESASRRALQIEEISPTPERYRIQATHYRILHDTAKAIEAYEHLAKVAPDDAEVELTLAKLYEDTRATDRAHDYYDKVLARDPKNVNALLGMGRVDLLRGDAQGSLDPLNRANALAMQFDNDSQKGAALFFLGTAFSLLNKPTDALNNYKAAIEIKRRLNDDGGTAQTLNSMAHVQQTLGLWDEALKNYNEALRLRKKIGDKRGTGNTLLDLGGFYDTRGKFDQALELTKQSLQIQRELGDPQNEASCLNNIGWIYLDKADYENAATYFQQALVIRENLKDPSAIADTVYNLADTASRMGDYDKGVTYFLRSLELWRTANDKYGLAIASYGMGTLFNYQGRYGAALSSEKDALDNIRQSKQGGLWLAQIQGGYANALTFLGRDAEVGKNLDEALSVAREVKNDALMARLLNYQGDRSFYRGDYKSARPLYEQALAASTRSKDRENTLISRINLAKLAVKEGRSRETIKPLRQLADEADRTGLKYLSVDCSTYLAEALIATQDYSHAREELDRALSTSEKLNLQMMQARSHYLLANALRLKGNREEAAHQYASARTLLDGMHNEAKTDDLLKRSDIAAMYADINRWANSPRS